MTVDLLRYKKKHLWLACLLPLLFVSDILYGGLHCYGIKLLISPGVLLRGLVFLIAIYSAVKWLPSVNRRLYYFIIVLVFSVVPSILIVLFHSQSFFFDLSILSKTLYFPLVTGLFVVLRSKYNIEDDTVLRFVEYAAYMLGISLLFSQQVGIQNKTYASHSFGSVGIFSAQNDMTLAFGLAMLSAAYRLVFVRFSLIRLVFFAMSTFACIQIGTRASLAVMLGIVFTITILFVWGRIPQKNKLSVVGLAKKIILSLLVVSLVTCVFIYGFSKQQEFNYQQRKLEQLARGEIPRLRLLLAGTEYISTRPLLINLTGEGFSAFQRGVALHTTENRERRMVEIGWVDIFGSCGVMFTILIHAFVLYVLLSTGCNFLIYRNLLHGLVAAATFLYLSNSIVAGHALVSPIPSTLSAAYFSIFYKTKSI